MALTEEGLTLKQAKFVNAYVETNGNATRAAEIAGYSQRSNETTRAIASENLTKPHVARAIEKRLKPVMDNDEILTELSEIGRHKPKEYTEKGKLKALEMLGKFGGLFNDNVTVTIHTDQVTSALRSLIDLKQRAGELPNDAELTAMIEDACRANNVDAEQVKAKLLTGETQ